MKITITGNDGIFTAATLDAQVGMIFMGNIITKVNDKSILIAKVGQDKNPIVNTVQKLDSLSLPFWTLSPEQSENVLTPDGRRYIPSEIEKAMQTLCHQGVDRAGSLIAAIADHFTRSGALDNQPITRYDGISAATLLTVIDKMANH